MTLSHHYPRCLSDGPSDINLYCRDISCPLFTFSFLHRTRFRTKSTLHILRYQILVNRVEILICTRELRSVIIYYQNLCSICRVGVLFYFILYFRMHLNTPRGVRLKCYYAFFLVCCGCDTSYIVSVHIQCQASISTLSVCRGHSWRVRLAKLEALPPPGHAVSPLVCRDQ